MIKRYENNPILSTKDIKPSQDGFVVECVLNPGVFTFEGKVWLVLRIAERPVQKSGTISFPINNGDNQIEIMEFDEDSPEIDLSDSRIIKYAGKSYLTTMSHLCLVCSDDGINFYEPRHLPTRIFGMGSQETYGIEDCRVNCIDGEYLLTYTQVSPYGVGVGLMRTRDWRNIQREGMIFSPHNKDCCIFQEKIGDSYYALHRPSGVDLGGNFIWISSSPDLIHWGHHTCVLTTRPGHWDCARVGAGASPIKTPLGWLEIYHGADYNHVYHLGAVLLDLDDPSKVLARSIEPILSPETEYEKNGFFGNVVFSNGHLVQDDEITLYYGASDEVICFGKLKISDVLNSLEPQLALNIASNHR